METLWHCSSDTGAELINRSMADGSEDVIKRVEPESLLDPLNEQEQEILQTLFDPTATVNAAIPDDTPPENLWQTFMVCSKVILRIKTAGDKIKPVIGRILNLIHKNQSIIEEHGYKNWNDFMSRGLWEMFRISRSEAFFARRIAEKMPWLTSEDHDAVGIARLEKIASQALLPKAEELVERVKNEKLTVRDLAQMAEDAKFGFERGSSTGKTLVIPMSLDIYMRWKEFVKDPQIQAYCAGGNAIHVSESSILESMMAECSAEWKATGEARLRQKAA
jgi:hypothetical protein